MKRKITLKQGIYEVDDGAQPCSVELAAKNALEEERAGITRILVKIRFPFARSPEPVRIQFSENAMGGLSFWTSAAGVRRGLPPDWRPLELCSRSASELPVFALFDANDRNVCTVSIDDPETPVALRAGFSEQNGNITFTICFFCHKVDPVREYSAELSIDRRPLPFYESIRQAVARLQMSYPPREVVFAAKLPVFSTWYCDHQRLSREKLLRDAEKAKALGMDVIIIDDGWQTEDASYGYGYCGDYEPACGKVGDMKSLVEQLHKIGMKVMLWYSVSFLGEYSAAAQKWRDKTLSYNEKQHCYVLDPRFSEVREFICEFLCRNVLRWGIDGLKLDFIDSFVLNGENIERSGVDCVSLEKGICRLLAEIRDTLTAIDPEFMIEFRQSYIGPVMRQLATMFRVNDCPGDQIRNRVGIADLRLTSGTTPVHADPIYFAPTMTAEQVGVYFANTLFAVAQVSVTPDALTPDQRRVVEHYLAFEKAYRDILLAGEFIAEGAAGNYICLRSGSENAEIAAIYANPYICNVEKSNAILVNGSGQSGLYANLKYGKYVCKITDCFGKETGKSDVSGIVRLDIPVGGMAFLERQDTAAEKVCPRN